MSVTAVSAQLPTITAVGMAALLPEADGNLHLKVDERGVVPFLKDQKVLTPADRLKWCESEKGDLVQMRDLDEILDGKMRISEKTILLLVKSLEIDQTCENIAPATIRMRLKVA